jgi:DNA-binding response OmpR family regulator
VTNEILEDPSLRLGMTSEGEQDGTSDARGVARQPSTTMKFQKKILLIDHEPGVTRLIRRALERAGKYVIREEHDDKLALNAARWFQPDLILVDTAGQERRDIEREIHADTALNNTPVLSLSSLRPESQMISGGILSGHSFFAAPIRVEEVLRGVDELLFGKD